MAHPFQQSIAVLAWLAIAMLGITGRAEGRSPNSPALFPRIPLWSGWAAPRRTVPNVRPIRQPGWRALTRTNFIPPRAMMETLALPEASSSRCGGCAQLLLPEFERTSAEPGDRWYHYGKTISDRPKLYIDINSPEGEVNLRVTLSEAHSDDPLAQSYRRYHSHGAGLYEVDLFRGADEKSKDLPPKLTVGRTYIVTVEVACLSPETSDWAYSKDRGVIQRVIPSAETKGRLSSASNGLERMEELAEAGFWIDLVAQTAELARDQPKNLPLLAVWLGRVIN